MFVAFCEISYSAVIKLKFENIRNDKGSILILLFSTADGFPDQYSKAIRQYRIPVLQARAGIVIDSLATGNYAISIVHDENNNIKLDKNLIGIPSEGIGFSNNPTVLFSSPNYEKCKFEVNKNQTDVEIKLKYF